MNSIIELPVPSGNKKDMPATDESRLMEMRRKEAQGRARPVSTAECARLARMPRAGGTLEALLKDGAGLKVIGRILCADGHPAPEEQARAWLNSGADALCLADATNDPFHLRMPRVWAVSEFLEQHGRSTPFWLRECVFCPAQLAEALEAGVQTLSITPALETQENILKLADCAAAAQIELVWEVDDAKDIPKASLICLRTLEHKKSALGASDLLKIYDGSIETMDDAALLVKQGFVALVWADLPEDEERARELVSALRGA